MAIKQYCDDDELSSLVYKYTNIVYFGQPVRWNLLYISYFIKLFGWKYNKCF